MTYTLVILVFMAALPRNTHRAVGRSPAAFFVETRLDLGIGLVITRPAQVTTPESVVQ
jgi:hypothetical protein